MTLAARCPLGYVICFLVAATRDMLELHAEEALLEPAHLLQVGGHVLVLGFVALVGEVDEELQISLDEDALDAQSIGGLEASDEALVLSDEALVVMLEAELYGVVQLVSCW